MEPLVPVEDDELGGEEGEVKVSLEDFTVHGIVGEGEFGKVSADLSARLRGLEHGTGSGQGLGSELGWRVISCSTCFSVVARARARVKVKVRVGVEGPSLARLPA